MAVIGIVVSCIHIIVILTIPSDIIEWVLHFADHVVGVLVAFFLACAVASLF